jgi:hypothetical protein
VKRLAALACLAVAACSSKAAEPTAATLVATPVPLDASDPAVNRVGALTYVGGLQLSVPSTSLFGGLSGLETTGSGALSNLELTAVSDAGDRFTFNVDASSGLRLAGDGQLRTGPLTEDGQPVGGGKINADAEDITQLDDGSLAVSFERRHRILRYTLDGRDAPMASPKVSLAENEGFEAIAELPLSGRKVLAVGVEDGRLFFCDVAPTGACQLILKSTPGFGYKLTALDHLPGTADLIATYRYWNPVQGSRAIIAWISTGVTGGKGPRVIPLARLAPPLTVDNMEGIAAVALPGRGWRLFVLSDDNFSDKQRTLLLAFDWLPQQPPGA